VAGPCDFPASVSLDPIVTDLGETTVALRLFEQHGLAVQRYLRRLTGESELARDLAQDVYLRVVRGAHRYDARERERAWLFRIARNVFLDHHKTRARRPRIAAVEAEPSSPASQSTRVALDAALGLLDELDRDAFLLGELGGLRYDEIATTLGLTVAGVRSRIYRARLALRAALPPPARPEPTIERIAHDD
jgi:RNA polymerase sigma-70 factor, ECF subfamily